MNHFFGQNLKTIRIQKQLSQAELGKQLHKGQKTIGNWETGYSEPCLEDLIRISHFFTIGLDQLLKEEIRIENPKAKAGRNRHKENDFQTEPSVPALDNMKQALQEAEEETGATYRKEIAWRDKHIAILENRLAEMTTGVASEQTLKDLTSRILSLQKTIAGLTVQ